MKAAPPVEVRNAYSPAQVASPVNAVRYPARVPENQPQNAIGAIRQQNINVQNERPNSPQGSPRTDRIQHQNLSPSPNQRADAAANEAKDRAEVLDYAAYQRYADVKAPPVYIPMVNNQMLNINNSPNHIKLPEFDIGK